MKPHYHTLYLSSHLDDVVLSCGAQIYDQTQAGKDVLVVTVMAGDPPETISGYAQSLHDRWELLVEAGAARRAEDLAACRILGADAHHWPIPDCPYRTDPQTGESLYLSDDDIFGDVHPAEMTLVQSVADRIATLPTADRVLAPLTIGHHVDHLLVRSAAEMLYAERLIYYEDYPYAQETAKQERTLRSQSHPLKPCVVAVSEAARQAKIEAILAYRSQLSTFWTDHADLKRQVFGYMDEVGGERLWSRE